MLPPIIRIRVPPLKVAPQVQLRRCLVIRVPPSTPGSCEAHAARFFRRGFRNRIDETDSSWLLEMSEAVGNVGAEFVFHFLAGSEAAAQGNEGHRNFSGRGIGTSDDPAVAYRRVLEQKSFH